MKQRRPAQEKIKHKYIFPNFIASAMKNTDMKTQMEAGMMSMFLLLIGMILMGIYSLMYLTQGWVFKLLLLFNLIAGFIFMSSYLVTTYQQYVSYMSVTDIQGIMNNNIKPKKNRKNQVLFFGGVLLILLGIGYYIYSKDYIISGILAFIGLISIILVFFKRKPKQNKEQTKVSGFKRLPKATAQDTMIKQKLDREIDELKQSQTLEQEELGINDALDNQIEPESGDEFYESETDNYYDYTQQPKQHGRFRGKDGRIYYY